MSTTRSEQNNVSIVRRRIEKFAGEGNVALADELFAPNYVNHDPPYPDSTRKQVQQNIIQSHVGLPDVHIAIEDIITEGDRVVTRYTLRGTHQGELRGIPPTGRRVTLQGIVISRVVEGRIVEEWNLSDKLGLMQQLGVIPAQVHRGKD